MNSLARIAAFATTPVTLAVADALFELPVFHAWATEADGTRVTYDVTVIVASIGILRIASHAHPCGARENFISARALAAVAGIPGLAEALIAAGLAIPAGPQLDISQVVAALVFEAETPKAGTVRQRRHRERQSALKCASPNADKCNAHGNGKGDAPASFEEGGKGGGARAPRGAESTEDSERARAFDDFWSAYPPRNGRKIGKAEARAEFCKLPADDVPLVMRALKHYTAADTIPKDAFRWLRKSRRGEAPWREWLSEPEPTTGYRNGSTRPTLGLGVLAAAGGSTNDAG